MKTKIYLIIVTILLSGCASVQKMIETGHFDTAVYKAAKKMSKSERKQRKYLPLFSEAYQIALERDLDKIEYLSRSDDSKDWYEIGRLYHKIGNRQELLNKFRPLFSSLNTLYLTYINADSLRQKAEGKYVNLLYDESLELLDQARKGYKLAAREAYYRLDKLLDYRHNYSDAIFLREEAEDMGITHVKINLENRSWEYIPPVLEEDILFDISPRDKWTKFHVRSTGHDYDYKLNIMIDQIHIGPEKINEESFMEFKEIEDGFEYVLDEQGNVKKDSLGNDIKEPKFRKIRARVFKTHQFKSAFVEGKLIVEDGIDGSESHFPVYGDIIFEHHGGYYKGNRKALSTETRKWVFKKPVPFPTNETMLRDALYEFKHQISSKISGMRWPV